jgi:hypothetical protein
VGHHRKNKCIDEAATTTIIAAVRERRRKNVLTKNMTGHKISHVSSWDISILTAKETNKAR